MSDTGSDSPDEGAELVASAHAVVAGRVRPDELERVFARSTVYAQRPERPGVLVGEIPGKGSWVMVFSSAQRLARFAGDCEFFATTGADLVAQLPDGIGVMVDPQDDHGVALSAPTRTRATGEA